MFHEEDIVWSPQSNYHNVDSYATKRILNTNDTCGDIVDIHASMHVFPYEIVKDEDSKSEDNTTELYSMTLIQSTEKQMVQKIISNKYYARRLTRKNLVECLKNIHSDVEEDSSSSEISDLLQDFLGNMKGQRIIDQQSATKFCQTFKLKPPKSRTRNNTTTLRLSTNPDDMHNNYREIYEAFRAKYNIYFSFVDGNHRAFALFHRYLNIEQHDITHKSPLNEDNSLTTYNMKLKASNEETSITFLSCNKEKFTWDSTLAQLKLISACCYRQMSTQVGKSLTDCIIEAAHLYLNDFKDAFQIEYNDRNYSLKPIENLSKEFMELSITEFNLLKPITVLCQCRAKWAQSLLQAGTALELLKSSRLKGKTIEDKKMGVIANVKSKIRSSLLLTGNYDRATGYQSLDGGPMSHRETWILIDLLTLMCPNKDIGIQNINFIEGLSFTREFPTKQTKQHNNNVIDIYLLKHIVICSEFVSQYIFDKIVKEKSKTDETFQPSRKLWTQLLLTQALFYQITELIRTYGLNPEFENKKIV